MRRLILRPLILILAGAALAGGAHATDSGTGSPAPDPLGGVTRFLAPDQAAPATNAPHHASAQSAPSVKNPASPTRTAAKSNPPTRTAQARPPRGPAFAAAAPPLGWRAPPVPPPPYPPYPQGYRDGPRVAWAPPPRVAYPPAYVVPYAVPYPAWRFTYPYPYPYTYPYGYAVVPRAYVRVW